MWKATVEIKTENVMELTFADGHFDVVLSNVDNIYNKEGRKRPAKKLRGCLNREVSVLIADFRHVENKKEFMQIGSPDGIGVCFIFCFLPPLTI